MSFNVDKTKIARGILAFAMAAILTCTVTAPPFAAADPDQPQVTESQTTTPGDTTEDPGTSQPIDTPQTEDPATPATSENSTAGPEDASEESAAKTDTSEKDAGAAGKKNKPNASDNKHKKDSEEQKRMSEKELAAHIDDAFSYSQKASAALVELNSLASAFPAHIDVVDKAHKGVVKVKREQKKLEKRGKRLAADIERAQEVVDAASAELDASQGTDLMSVVAGRATFDDIDSKAYLLEKTIADRESAIAIAQVAQGARAPKAKILAKKLKKAQKREKKALQSTGVKASELEQRIAEVRKYDRLATESIEDLRSYGPSVESALAAVERAAAVHETTLSSNTEMLLNWYTSANAASGVDAHQEITGIALQYLGVKYVWGGETPKGGFDCSGLTMYCYNKIGKPLTHFAQTQYSEGRHIEKDALMPGDLVFFGTGMDNITHVGIYLGNGEFIHAPHPGDVVKVSKLSIMSNYVAACRP